MLALCCKLNRVFLSLSVLVERGLDPGEVKLNKSPAQATGQSC